MTTLALASGLSPFAVWKVWKANGLKPHPRSWTGLGPGCP